MLLNDTLTLAPRARARDARLRRVLATLHLPEGRLGGSVLRRLVEVVASHPELYEDLVVDDPDHRWWLVLHLAANVDVRVLSWERDQGSDWHDHGGSSGAFLVTAGSLVERSRAGDGVSLVTRTLSTGEAASFGPAHVHDVQHAAGAPAVSVHAYSPPLSGLTYYDRGPCGFVAREVVPEERRAAFELAR